MLLMSTHHAQLWPEFSWNSLPIFLARWTLELSIEEPIGNSVTRDAKCVRNSSVGNFKARVKSTGKADFCPVLRLVSLTEGDISTGLRGEHDKHPPQPDALSPWDPIEQTRKGMRDL